MNMILRMVSMTLLYNKQTKLQSPLHAIYGIVTSHNIQAENGNDYTNQIENASQKYYSEKSGK